MRYEFQVYTFTLGGFHRKERRKNNSHIDEAVVNLPSPFVEFPHPTQEFPRLRLRLEDLVILSDTFSILIYLLLLAVFKILKEY